MKKCTFILNVHTWMLAIIFLLIQVSVTAQKGAYLEMKLTTQKSGTSGTMKVYALNGDSRTEMNMATSGMQINTISLTLKSTPTKLYLLAPASKTYTEVEISGSDKWVDEPKENYEITVIGKEKVNGYNTVHVKVKSKTGKNEFELWNTTELSGFADFAKVRTQFTGKDNLWKALEAKQAQGYPVRIKSADKGETVQLDLVKAEFKDVQASLFSLKDYTKGASFNPGGNMQEMIKNMMNMTPEEREKLMKQMQEMYQPKQ